MASSLMLRRISMSRPLINGVRSVVASTRTMSSVVSNNSTLTHYSRISSLPWLMVPQVFDTNTNNSMVYKFYSLEENKVLNVTNSSHKSFMHNHDDDIEFISSTNGWLTLFNKRNCDLFLFNPITGRHIKLPPLRTLCIPEENLKGGFGCVVKLITSCSPEDEECRVLMSYGPCNRLAFCSPSSSTPEWTPIGELYDGLGARCYEDFVYSSTKKLFYCITHCEELEGWDLHDGIGSLKTNIPTVSCRNNEVNYELFDARSEENKRMIKFLVVTEESGDIYIVTRHVGPDGSDVEKEKVPYTTTFGFGVYKYDPERFDWEYMDGSIDGLTLFVGNKHAFAVSASDFPELKPDSIYFSDICNSIPPSLPFGGHDVGIFSYKDGTVSPCYYPCDTVTSIKRMDPAPMWFTPIH